MTWVFFIGCRSSLLGQPDGVFSCRICGKDEADRFLYLGEEGKTRHCLACTSRTSANNMNFVGSLILVLYIIY